MSYLIHKDDFKIAKDSVREHCQFLGLSEVRTVTCESIAVSDLTAGKSLAAAIGRGKQKAEEFSAQAPRGPAWKRQPSRSQPSVSPQGGA